jgi:hypothetical protein
MHRNLVNRLIWVGFSIAVVLATAPAWRFYAFGFNPTLDQILQTTICGGPVR